MLCPFCKDSKPYKINVHNLYKCNICGLIINPIDNPDIIKIKNRNFLLGACNNRIKRAERLKEAVDQCSTLLSYNSDIKEIYDVGCATGFFMIIAKAFSLNPRGNDVSIKAIEWAKEHYDLTIDYGFFEDIDLEVNSFDAVVMWNSLEHTYNPKTTLLRAYNILRNNGLLYIKVPNKTTLAELNQYYEDLHLFEFTIECLSTHLAALGFVKIFAEKSSNPNPNDHTPCAVYLYKVIKE